MQFGRVDSEYFPPDCRWGRKQHISLKNVHDAYCSEPNSGAGPFERLDVHRGTQPTLGIR